jgi:hypothetical protein
VPLYRKGARASGAGKDRHQAPRYVGHLQGCSDGSDSTVVLRATDLRMKKHVSAGPGARGYLMRLRIARIPTAPAPTVKAIKRRKSSLSVLILSLLVSGVFEYAVRVLLTWTCCDRALESRATSCAGLFASL